MVRDCRVGRIGLHQADRSGWPKGSGRSGLDGSDLIGRVGSRRVSAVGQVCLVDWVGRLELALVGFGLVGRSGRSGRVGHACAVSRSCASIASLLASAKSAIVVIHCQHACTPCITRCTTCADQDI